MTAANKPENQKTQGGLSDLGQITFRTKRAPNGIDCFVEMGIYTACIDSKCTGKDWDLRTWASLNYGMFNLCMALDDITSPEKARRDSAKKRIREWAAWGRAVNEEAMRRIREFEAQEDQQ